MIHRDLLMEKFNLPSQQEYTMMIVLKYKMSPYQIYKNVANLMYVSSLCAPHLETNYFYSIHSDTFQVEKIEIGDYVKQVKKYITTLRKILNYASLYHKTSMGPLLYPNMKIDSSPQMNQFKLQIAKEVGELTMICYVAEKQKQLAYQQGMYSWKDERLDADIMGLDGKKKHIVDKILTMNRQSSTESWLNIDRPFIYESFFTHDDKTNVYIDFEYNYDYLYLIGIQEGDQYRSFWMQEWTEAEQIRLLHEWNAYLDTCSNKFVWYWYVEKSKYLRTCQRFQIEPRNVDHWNDLYLMLRDGTVTIKHAFNYKLKSIVNALYINKQIDYHYQEIECQNGLQSIEMAKDYYKTKNEDIKHHIEQYNQMDCKAMRDIYLILQKNI